MIIILEILKTFISKLRLRINLSLIQKTDTEVKS